MRFLKDIRHAIADTGDLILVAALVLSAAKLVAIYFSG
jgi:hypothetical protein